MIYRIIKIDDESLYLSLDQQDKFIVVKRSEFEGIPQLGMEVEVFQGDGKRLVFPKRRSYFSKIVGKTEGRPVYRNMWFWTMILLYILIVLTLLNLFLGKRPIMRESVSSSFSTMVSSKTSLSKSLDSKESSTFTSSAVDRASSSLVEETAVDYPIQLSEIEQGDFSSLVGVWKNDKGTGYVFDENGLVGYVEASGQLQTGFKLGSMGQNADGTKFFNVTVGATGFALAMLPKGTQQEVGAYQDVSDSSKNRLWAGQSADSISNPSSYFYKVE